MTEQMKRCTKCGVVKPVSEFSKNRTCKDGYHSHCKECGVEYRRIYYRANREKVIEHIRKYREDNPEKVAERCRKYRDRHREELAERSRNYYSCVKRPSCPRVGQRGAEFMTFTCEVCGNQFRRRKSEVDWRYEHDGRLPRFCSRECYFASMRKGYKSPYARKIEEIRKRVKA